VRHGGNRVLAGFSQGPTHPVVGVNWNDAEEFCKWLTKSERSAGDLPQDREYRLPKDEEWSAAVGLKNEVGSTPEEKHGKIELYPWDIPQKRDKSWPPPAGAGNYAEDEAKNGDWPSDFQVIEGYNDGYPRTSPVGSFEANFSGLYDMGGNVNPATVIDVSRHFSSKQARNNSLISGLFERKMPLFSQHLTHN
jgi:eukaryotic-like serine/threonine-protein kinase